MAHPLYIHTYIHTYITYTVYPLHQSLGHAKSSQSSLVVSWQWIYNSLTVYSVVLLRFSFSLFHNCQLRNSTLLHPLCTDSTENVACTVDKACLQRRCLAKSIFPRVCFCGNVFSDPLPNNGHGTDHIENNSCNAFSIVAWAYFGRCLEMRLHVTIMFIILQPFTLHN
jgi:hypothetical protein